MLPIIKLNFWSNNNHTESCDWLLNNCSFTRVRTKRSKGDDWSGLSIIGFSQDPMNIEKPNVLGSEISSSTLTPTDLYHEKTMKSVVSLIEDIKKE